MRLVPGYRLVTDRSALLVLAPDLVLDQPSKATPSVLGRGVLMNATPAGQPRPSGHRIDPKYVPYLVPAIMAIAMSFTMSLVQNIARVGFSSNLPSAWLTSFAIGVAVAIPTVIFIAPRARRLAGHLTGSPRAVPERLR